MGMTDWRLPKEIYPVECDRCHYLEMSYSDYNYFDGPIWLCVKGRYVERWLMPERYGDKCRGEND